MKEFQSMGQLENDHLNCKGNLVKKGDFEFSLAIVESGDVFRAGRLPDVKNAVEVLSKIISSTWKTKISTHKN
jgi:hypothetical protein